MKQEGTWLIGQTSLSHQTQQVQAGLQALCMEPQGASAGIPVRDLTQGAELLWGTTPESSSKHLPCLFSPQITSPSRSALLSLTITLAFAFRLHFQLFQGSRQVSSVILKLTLFLPLPGGILATLLSKITGVFSLLRCGNASLLDENHLLHLTGQ